MVEPMTAGAETVWRNPGHLHLSCAHDSHKGRLQCRFGSRQCYGGARDEASVISLLVCRSRFEKHGSGEKGSGLISVSIW